MDVIEVWECDPTGDCGCGPGSVRVSMIKAQRIMNEIKRHNEVFERLKSEFGQIKVVRDVVSSRRPRGSYPTHVCEFLDAGERPPLFFMNSRLVHSNTFPTYNELERIISSTYSR